MAEDFTLAQASRRHTSLPMHEHRASDSDASQSSFEAYATQNYSTSLLAGRSLNGRGNAPARASNMLAAQRTHGNHAVQRYLQDRAVEAATSAANSDVLAQRIEAASGQGSNLEPAVRGRIEKSVGADMSNVRVHTGAEADQLARSMNAIAFTTGYDIFFRHGEYSPHSTEGLRLLAHEATHTVQQSAGPVAGTPAPGGVSISDPSDSFEQEAERTAERVTSGSSSAGTDAISRQSGEAATPGKSVQRMGGVIPPGGGGGGILGSVGGVAMDTLNNMFGGLASDPLTSNIGFPLLFGANEMYGALGNVLPGLFGKGESQGGAAAGGGLSGLGAGVGDYIKDLGSSGGSGLVDPAFYGGGGGLADGVGGGVIDPGFSGGGSLADIAGGAVDPGFYGGEGAGGSGGGLQEEGGGNMW